MQQQDQSERLDTVEMKEQTLADKAEQTSLDEIEENASETPIGQLQLRRQGFDWPALIAALAIAAFFAVTARMNSQPAPSFIPAAIFSATGCGLLVTAIRKLRGWSGVGLREAGMAGLGMALFQFAIALTYPGVLTNIAELPEDGHPFLVTWGLIALFAVVLSLAGAAIGHLAFAPLRPLPGRTKEQEGEDEAGNESETNQETEVSAERMEESEDSQNEEEAQDETTEAGEIEETADEDEEEDEDESAQIATASAQLRNPLINYTITIVLLGLLPMMAGYVFAATYDFIMGAMNVDKISPALYPTLSLLSGLLPWRLAAPINLSGASGSFIVFTLLWRIPDSVLGNPSLFDVQALEALVFNASALAFLLIAMYKSDSTGSKQQAAPWGLFLLLESLLGLLLILPANLWLLRGLEGILQLQNLLAALPPIQLLNPATFILNLVTGVLFCALVGVIVRRQYHMWNFQPRMGGDEPLTSQAQPENRMDAKSE